jgi:hypothetical protein
MFRLLIFTLFYFNNAPALFASPGVPDKEPVMSIRQDYAGTFTVTLHALAEETATLVIFDATGKYIFLKNLRFRDGEITEVVDLSRFPRGIYIFEVESNSFRETKKVVFNN